MAILPNVARANRIPGVRSISSFHGARTTAPVKLPIQYRNTAIYGVAPIGGPQGNLHHSLAAMHGYATGTLYPAPVIPQKQYSTGHTVARTVQPGSVPVQTKPHGVPAFRGKTAKPYGGPPPTPLMLGSRKQVGRDTVRKPVYQPPQTLIPAVMRKLFKRG